ncbi:hypothetical protein GPECTOR_13g846 [Gonium pectorale]|uniref:AB hydrolase-1 domain-containing protein n=1 Tax=Gonium pectorale TaxID=33097 RepID=A0A150GNJ8_GONPE|nr:hypothetical protein GPECTOR_13g846 [Gonium pectorale]|eukprot:KXZ51358.1 hypothetical protein GPECTOR_13g846 [Gonium pectorale]
MVNITGKLLVLCFCLRGLLEAAVGVLLWPVLRFFLRETPQVTYNDTSYNSHVYQVAHEDVHLTVDNTHAAQQTSNNVEPLSPKQLMACKGFPMHCDMDDMETVARHVHSAFPSAPKLLVGFSAGANVVVKYLGLQGNKENPFVAAVSVCNGHELVPLTKEFLKRPVANTLMAQALQGLLKSKYSEVEQICTARGLHVDFRGILSTNNVRQFETELMLQLFPEFSDIDAYYAYNSCHEAFKDVSIPLLAMATCDDPLIHRDLTDHAVNASKGNPNVLSVRTNTGGHLGWLTGWNGRWWQQDVVFSFLDGVLALRYAATCGDK